MTPSVVPARRKNTAEINLEIMDYRTKKHDRRTILAALARGRLLPLRIECIGRVLRLAQSDQIDAMTGALFDSDGLDRIGKGLNAIARNA